MALQRRLPPSQLVADSLPGSTSASCRHSSSRRRLAGSAWLAVAGCGRQQHSSCPPDAAAGGRPTPLTCCRWAPGPQRRCGAGAGWGQTRAAHRAPAVEGRGVGSHMLTRLANPAMPGGVHASRTPSKPFSMHRCCCTAQTTLSWRCKAAAACISAAAPTHRQRRLAHRAGALHRGVASQVAPAAGEGAACGVGAGRAAGARGASDGQGCSDGAPG